METAVVIPILKPGKIPNLWNPIDRHPTTDSQRNWHEKMAAARLNDYLENENIPSSGAGTGSVSPSTTHQLLRVVEYIKDGIDRHQYTAAVFLDIQKAFSDRVYKATLGLLPFKLIMYKIRTPTTSSPKILHSVT
ncbi:hypothetical protein TNCV_5033701 [Trichonephila clavipes]|nr:hypothetical protein TNCV_5033701 [Trichonephila clavipes]